MIKKNKCSTLCFTFVRPEDTLPEILKNLLYRVQALGIAIKRLYLDKQFAQVDVLGYLKKQSYVSVVAIPKKGHTLQALQRGKKSYRSSYTMKSSQYGSITFALWIACRYCKGRAKKHGVAYLFFAVLGDCRRSELHIAEEYRHRFGIEASYRLMHHARALTTSKNAALRLLLVAIAFLLANVWVWCKWHLSLMVRRQQRKPRPLTLDIFCHFVSHHIEHLYGAVASIRL